MNSTKRLLHVCLFALIIIIPINGLAQWSEKGIPVCSAGADQLEPLIISAADGGVIVAWLDPRNGYRSNIYAQRIDAYGRTLWQRDGISVITGNWLKRNLAMSSDLQEGALIAWHDRRHETSGDIYCQRIDADGNALWNENGVAACRVAGGQSSPRIFSDGFGGAIVYWIDTRNKLGYCDIWMQRIRSDGTVLWDKSGISVLTGWNRGITGRDAVLIDNNDVIIAWEMRNRFKGEMDIHVQRIDLNGNVLWQTNGIPICRALGNQSWPQVMQDYQGGAFICWSDSRNKDIYAQRINIEGDAYWELNGVPVCSAPGEQIHPVMVGDYAGGGIILFADKNRIGDSDSDLYAQRFNNDGNLLWGNGGIPICTSESDQIHYNIRLDDNGCAIIVWTDSRNSVSACYAQKLIFDGSRLWDPQGIVLCQEAVYGSSVRITPDHKGGLFATWIDKRNINNDIYATRLYGNGKPLDTFVDVIPDSCPNIVDRDYYKSFEVALCGSDTFSVDSVDLLSVNIHGVPPNSWSFRDITRPNVNSEEYVCRAEGPDGFIDLLLCFDLADIWKTLGKVNEGDTNALLLNCSVDNFTSFSGNDCMIVGPEGTNRIERTWYVKADGTGDAANVQSAIYNAHSGDTILLAPGKFTGNGNCNISFMGKSLLLRSESGPDSTIFAGIGNNDFRLLHLSNAAGLSILEGVTIDNFCCDDYGAIYCNSSSLEIRDCRIINCLTGIISDSSELLVKSCFFSDNFGPYASIYCDSSNAIISDNIFQENESTGYSAIYCTNGSYLLESNYITGNTTYGSGGGIWIENSVVEMINNSICGNYAEEDGGGVSMYRCKFNLHNNEIRGNTAKFNGGGIYLSSCEDKSIINANSIEENYTWRGHGAGVYCYGSSIEIKENAIQNNWAPYDYNAGGIYCAGTSSPSIIGNVIRNNGCGYYSFQGDYGCGGGICSTRYCAPIIAYNLIQSNWGYLGAGIYINANKSKPSLIHNNTIVGNTGGIGLGVYCHADSNLVVRNNIVASNHAVLPWYKGGGVYLSSPYTMVSCCDVFRNDGGNYNGVGDITGINGNISSDPLFCDAHNGDYSLHAESPCLSGTYPNGYHCGIIGAYALGCGVVATMLQSYEVKQADRSIEIKWSLLEDREPSCFNILRKNLAGQEYADLTDTQIERTDLDYHTRDRNIEPGESYQYQIYIIEGKYKELLFETDAVVVPSLPLTLYQNYPNPFNPSTTIRYSVPERCHVRLEVFDVAGRRVSVLVDRAQSPGRYSIDWNGCDDKGSTTSSGIYFYRLTAGKEKISKKMVLLR